MINLYEFDWQNESHMKLANDGIDVMFLCGFEGIFCKGFLGTKVTFDRWGEEEYTPIISYTYLGTNKEINAQSELFAPIIVNDKYTEIKYIGG